MDTRHTGEILKHLEKQNELLMDAYRSMTHEVHKLQVEEEMLMRKFNEFMSAQGLTRKNCDADGISSDGINEHSGALVATTDGVHFPQNDEQHGALCDGVNGGSGALVAATDELRVPQNDDGFPVDGENGDWGALVAVTDGMDFPHSDNGEGEDVDPGALVVIPSRGQ